MVGKLVVVGGLVVGCGLGGCSNSGVMGVGI